jgi:hypothetical protein
MPPLRFRIRTTMIVTAVIAVLMWLIGVWIHRASIEPFWVEIDGMTVWIVTDYVTTKWVSDPLRTTTFHRLYKTQVLPTTVAVASALLYFAILSCIKRRQRCKLRGRPISAGTLLNGVIAMPEPCQRGKAEKV